MLAPLLFSVAPSFFILESPLNSLDRWKGRSRIADTSSHFPKS